MSSNADTRRDAASADRTGAVIRRPAAWMWLVLVVAGGAFVASRLLDTPPDRQIVLVAWIGVALQAAVLLGWGWLILPSRRARASTVIASVLLGLTFAPAASILVLNGFGALGADRVLVAPFVEEPLKAAAVVVVLLLLGSRLRGPLDGLVIGFLVGAGFAVVENVLYVYSASSVGNAWQLVVTRLITQLGAHALWTAVIGAALAYLIVSRGRRWALLVAALMFSIALHFAWNASGVWVPGILSLAVTAVVMAVTIVGFLRVRRWSAAFEARTAQPGIGDPRVNAP